MAQVFLNNLRARGVVLNLCRSLKRFAGGREPSLKYDSRKDFQKDLETKFAQNFQRDLRTNPRKGCEEIPHQRYTGVKTQSKLGPKDLEPKIHSAGEHTENKIHRAQGHKPPKNTRTKTGRDTSGKLLGRFLHEIVGRKTGAEESVPGRLGYTFCNRC